MSCADGTQACSGGAQARGGTPSSNRGIYGEIIALQQMGRRGALATPVRMSGSVPCVDQSRLLIREDGSILGTIGGGPLEAKVLQEAPNVIEADKPLLLDLRLTQNEATGLGMVCGGECTILVEPIGPGCAEDVYAAAAKAEAEGTDVTLITVLPDQYPFSKLALLPDGALVGTTGDAETDSKLTQVASAVKDGPSLVEEPFLICIQPVRSLPSLVIFGAGHVAVPVASLARLVGFRITVVDDRAEFANAQRFPQADRVLVANVDDAFNDVTIDGGTYVVVVTRGHALDEEVVAHALRTPAAYIGMIGSKRKVAAISQRLGDRGFTESDLARLHAPIGIEIGAETVEEIAISIVAQLVAVRRGVELPPVGHASAS